VATRLGRASDATVAAPCPVSRNERLNEGLVRLRLTDNGYYAPGSGVAVAEQTSEIAQVKKMLKHASRGPKGGKGSPDFIISTSNAKDVLSVIECKASPRDHESPARDQPARYAVDGALHYARRYLKAIPLSRLEPAARLKQSYSSHRFSGGALIRPTAPSLIARAIQLMTSLALVTTWIWCSSRPRFATSDSKT
jgi:hypothetical protein